MTDKKLNEAYYQPDHLWAHSKVIRDLCKYTFVPIICVKSKLQKQALWQVHIPSPKE